MRLRQGKNKGFTLMELMIAVAIISILAGVAYPAYTSQIAKGRRAECRSGILQSMQQQERYYSQFNAYAPFTIALATAKSKSFSGDSLETSSCKLTGVDCTPAGGTAVNQCIEIRATPSKADASIDYLYLDSDGNKGCSISTTRTSSNKICWP